MLIYRRSLMGALWLAGLVGLAFALDEPVRRCWEVEIRSMQTRVLLGGFRTWGEASTMLVIAAGTLALDRRHLAGLLATVLAIGVSVAAVDGLKLATNRTRPHQLSSADRSPRSNSSFPSSHVASAFGFARGMTELAPGLRPVALAAGALTAVSRMHDRKHFLSDCVVGAIIGWFLTGLLVPPLRGFIARMLPTEWRPLAVGKSDVALPRVRLAA
jgi:membrane-associated phospholipid phosphatase